MKLTKTIFGLLLVLIFALCLIPLSASAEEGEYVYLSISFDGKYIDDQYGNPITYIPVSMDDIRSVNLADYGLEHLCIDNDGDGVYETTALQLLIYAHKNLYGGDWGEVNFDDIPGSSYFAGGIFGFTENLVYFHNGDFPVDESQYSDFMTIGATSDRIVLRPGDFLDVASFSCYSFLWDTLGGFHFFAEESGSFTHEYTTQVGQELNVHLLHSFCDLMYGEGWCVDAEYFDIYYGTTYGEPMGVVTCDESGMAQIIFEEPGTYYIWCEGGHGDDFTHTSCDFFFETGMPCIVSAPAYSKVVVSGGEPATKEKFDIAYARMILGNAMEFQFAVPQAAVSDWTGTYAVIEKSWADGATTTKTIAATEWGTATIADQQYWAVVYDGLAAKEMADTFKLTIYNAQGEAISNTWIDAVRDYVLRNLDAHNEKSNALMIDMLCYGAAAQENFSYGTNDLATAKLTPEQLALGTTASPTLTDTRIQGQNYTGTRLILKSRIQMQVAFNGLTEDMYAIYTFTNSNGYPITVRVDGKDFITAGDLKGIELSRLVYADARNQVTITVYNADGTVYGTVTDSIESYAKRTTNDRVCTALMKFADSAKAYLY